MNAQVEILRSKIRSGHHEMVSITDKYGADSNEYRQIQKNWMAWKTSCRRNCPLMRGAGVCQ